MATPIGAKLDIATKLVKVFANAAKTMLGIFHRNGDSKRSAARLEQGFEFQMRDVWAALQRDEISPAQAEEIGRSLIEQGTAALSAAKLGNAGEAGIRNMTQVIQAYFPLIRQHQQPILKTTKGKIAIAGIGLLGIAATFVGLRFARGRS